MLADAIIAGALLAPALTQVGAGVGIAATVGGFAAAFKWGKRLNRTMARVENQVTPNGGQGDNLGDRARRTEEAVARMEGRLLDHESRLTAHAIQLATNLEQLSRNSSQLDHIEQQIAQAAAPSVTVNTTTSTSPQQARRTPLPPPPPGVNE